jgi:hypothetical protein
MDGDLDTMPFDGAMDNGSDGRAFDRPVVSVESQACNHTLHPGRDSSHFRAGNNNGRPDEVLHPSRTSDQPQGNLPIGTFRETPLVVPPDHSRACWPDAQQASPQIETVLNWPVVIFFLALYTKHQHHLMPLVHVPTFAQDVLSRKDRHDEVFRAVLLSLGE